MFSIKKKLVFKEKTDQKNKPSKIWKGFSQVWVVDGITGTICSITFQTYIILQGSLIFEEASKLLFILDTSNSYLCYLRCQAEPLEVCNSMRTPICIHTPKISEKYNQRHTINLDFTIKIC